MTKGKLSLAAVRGILSGVECEVAGMPWRIHCGKMGDGFYIQLRYDEPDVETSKLEEQHARKWYVSPFSCKSEIVQTVLKACLTSAEHMIREHFKYRGERILGPHFDVDEIVSVIQEGRLPPAFRK